MAELGGRHLGARSWRASQARARRMTPRGRATLVAFVAAAAGAGWLLAAGPPAAPDAAAPALPVSAPPPSVPLALLRHPPVSIPQPADPSAARLAERVEPPPTRPDLPGPLYVEYALEPALTAQVTRILRRGRVALGHVVVLDPLSGRTLAYASTDPERFAPTRSYPAASLIKIVTAAAALAREPERAARPCLYVGSPYRLTPSRLDPPLRGIEVSLRRALATSNNQCFARLAVHALGRDTLLDAISSFGLDEPPAPGHAAGAVDPGEDLLDLGRLGCGLAGCRITPLHAARLAATLARGEAVEPFWIERVRDARGRELRLPDPKPPRRVMSSELAADLREMLVETTVSGTARRAFRTRRGGRLLGPVRVAGKTGSLSGRDPDGRYEWFIGVAPAEAPRVAIAVLTVHGDLWWLSPAQIAAEVLKWIFCPRGVCDPGAARVGPPESAG